MTYYANYSINHVPNKVIEDTNKARLIADIRSIANGNRPQGSCCSWRVWYIEGKYLHYVAMGSTTPKGKKMRVDARDLKYYREELT